MALAFAILLPAQNATSAHRRIKDWTSHHLIFSNPGTRDDAVRKGTLGRWERIANDPRYIMQQEIRGTSAAVGPIAASAPPTAPVDDGEGPPDFGAPLADLAPETIPLPRGIAKAGAGPPPGPNIAPEPDKRHPHHIHTDWSETLSSTTGAADAAGATTGLGNFPATITSGSYSCTDLAIFNTGMAGSTSQPTIVGYDNLYTTGTGGTCGSNPSVLWAFNTGTGSAASTGVAFSEDGTQVAFVQESSTNVATLVLLKFGTSTSGTLSAPTTLTSQSSASAYRSCTAPCMFTITFNGSPADTYSSPFPDLTPTTGDNVYVGDDTGKLHKFTGVFLGTPAELNSGGWPVTVSSSGSPLSSPVYDGASTNVFVGDYLAFTSTSTCSSSPGGNGVNCGVLYSVNSSSTAGAIQGYALSVDSNFGILDSPIVDSTAGTVYVFAGAWSNIGDYAAVFSLPVGFGNATGYTGQGVGPGYEFMMSGAFDNAYFQSTNATGNLYVVGNTGAGNNTLYQIPITNNAMSTEPTAVATLATNYTNGYYTAGLQVTEYYNTTTGTDYVYTSVLSYGAVANCTNPSLFNGCVLGYNVTNPSSITFVNATGEAGGTTGIVIDDSAPNGASNIYFSTLLNQGCTTSGGTNGCAIQTAQSAP
jgi:hypothetical protein